MRGGARPFPPQIIKGYGTESGETESGDNQNNEEQIAIASTQPIKKAQKNQHPGPLVLAGKIKVANL
jgi:hypothetical protein